MYTTMMVARAFLYEAEKSKLLEHRPHAEESLSMCLNANKYQVIPIRPNSVLFTGSLHACEKKGIWAESQNQLNDRHLSVSVIPCLIMQTRSQ